MARQLLRKPAVLQRYGRGNSTLHLDINRGLFVPPVSLGARCSAWPSDEVDAIINARVAGQTDDQIRALVKRLVAARANALQAA